MEIKPRYSQWMIAIILLAIVYLFGYVQGSYAQSNKVEKSYITLYDNAGNIDGMLRVEIENEDTLISTMVYSYSVKTDELKSVFCRNND